VLKPVPAGVAPPSRCPCRLMPSRLTYFFSPFKNRSLGRVARRLLRRLLWSYDPAWGDPLSLVWGFRIRMSRNFDLFSRCIILLFVDPPPYSRPFSDDRFAAFVPLFFASSHLCLKGYPPVKSFTSPLSLFPDHSPVSIFSHCPGLAPRPHSLHSQHAARSSCVIRMQASGIYLPLGSPLKRWVSTTVFPVFSSQKVKFSPSVRFFSLIFLTWILFCFSLFLFRLVFLGIPLRVP